MNGVNDVIQFGNKITVLANSTWPAIKGKNLLSAKWEEETSLESTADHDKKLLALFDSNTEPERNDGDVDKAFAEADEVLTRVYESPFLPHSCLEPMNFYADVTADKVHLVGPIQTPQWTAGYIAKMLDRPEEDIHLEMTRMGGGFGRRLYGDFAVEATEISATIGKPMRVVLSGQRSDQMPRFVSASVGNTAPVS